MNDSVDMNKGLTVEEDAFFTLVQPTSVHSRVPIHDLETNHSARRVFPSHYDYHYPNV
jgi:hypothetical protein